MTCNRFGLMLIVTPGCTAKCTHCCLACGPDKANIRLSEAEMMDYIEQAHQLGADGVCFTGGEPLIAFGEILNPMMLARSLGMYVDVRTNAYWARRPERADETLAILHTCGLQRLGLSFDAYHAQYVAESAIVNAARATASREVEMYLDYIGAEDYSHVAQRFGIQLEEVRAVMPPLKVGAATQLPDSDFRWVPAERIVEEQYNVNCNYAGREYFLSIFPGRLGAFYPCCWVNPRLLCHFNRLADIIEQAGQDPAVQFLERYGIPGLLDKALVRWPGEVRSHYSSQCELCYQFLDKLAPRDMSLPGFIMDFYGNGYAQDSQAIRTK